MNKLPTFRCSIYGYSYGEILHKINKEFIEDPCETRTYEEQDAFGFDYDTEQTPCECNEVAEKIKKCIERGNDTRLYYTCSRCNIEYDETI